MIARTFLLEPEQVKLSVQEKGSSKRKPNLTYDELQEIANRNEVGILYGNAVEGLFNTYFTRADTTRSSLVFKKGGKAILSLFPMSSSSQYGLKFQVYATRFCECLGISLEHFNSVLPQNQYKWEYYADAPPEWSGYEGFFANQEDLNRFLNLQTNQPK